MKTLRIADIGTTSIYTLVGSVLTMTESGGCGDALTENGCRVDEGMSDAEIESAVYDAWCVGYDGDPEANGLVIEVVS